jgi:hypothetical protein
MREETSPHLPRRTGRSRSGQQVTGRQAGREETSRHLPRRAGRGRLGWQVTGRQAGGRKPAVTCRAGRVGAGRAGR